jgi:beta-RFAP synthase
LNEARTPIAASVIVTVPARLHLGFLDLNGSLGRRFGSIGLAIDGFKTRLTIKNSPHNSVEGPDSDRAAEHLAVLQRALGLNEMTVTIEEAIPAHAGLGSGTQLALAVSAAVRRLNALPLDVRGDATRLSRGNRSGIGIGLFEAGRLVVDGGRGNNERAAPIISRIPFPDSWRVLVVHDPQRQGVHGSDESKAFAQLPAFSAEEAAHLCRLVLMKALPAVAEDNLVDFGSAIKELQQHLGEYFAPLQGGNRFSSPAVATALDLMAQDGAHGIGQSSWGPTGFAFAASPEEAERIAESATRHASAQGLDIRICRALNRGAEVTIEPATS